MKLLKIDYLNTSNVYFEFPNWCIAYDASWNIVIGLLTYLSKTDLPTKVQAKANCQETLANLFLPVQ